MAQKNPVVRAVEGGETEAEKKEPVPEAADPLADKLMKTRQVLLSGEINKTLAEKIIRQVLVMEADSGDAIRVFIDSPGGDADAGYAIFDMLRFVSAPVYTVGMGLVASAGSLVLLAAPRERRLALPNSHYLIHQPLSGIKGVATEIEIHAQELEKLRAKLNRLIADETGKTVGEVQKDTDRDYWMNAEEALAYGLVSRVAVRRADIA
ncbi:ATP-dependent Clp protease proteolytic subunit [Treponema endosymbiont of Eucomonympha sp.]|uniref:ATP-dependent Clp protease proteolytic subunit n=1 Tax=Treponema endosymbiont of Eucomonympha sp. TaxID=1580831 RepID=UPI000750DF2E|nr:ATP-dependent Clp protease proteolytic subunit [Treponema endosymbiont of Eucomonympha sp.]